MPNVLKSDYDRIEMIIGLLLNVIVVLLKSDYDRIEININVLSLHFYYS